MNQKQSIKQGNNAHVRPDIIIPSSVNIENKALRPDIVLRYKKENMALFIKVSFPSDFGRNNTEIKKMTKYQHLRNEVKRSWKLKSAKIVPVVNGAIGMMKNNLTNIP